MSAERKIILEIPLSSGGQIISRLQIARDTCSVRNEHEQIQFCANVSNSKPYQLLSVPLNLRNGRFRNIFHHEVECFARRASERRRCHRLCGEPTAPRSMLQRNCCAQPAKATLLYEALFRAAGESFRI